MVLKYDKAKEWLLEQAKEVINNYDNDPESTAETIKELLEYISILDDDWEYVLIEECPMAGCGINIRQLVVKEI